MNTRITLMAITFIIALFISSCEKFENVDRKKPVIDLTDSYPTTDATLYFRESFEVKFLLKDDMELGSYSLEIHDNFDHHSHSTEVSSHKHEPQNNLGTENPFYYNKTYKIPLGLREYTVRETIEIPGKTLKGAYFDEGDYHFVIQVTDKAGWSTHKGISVRIADRP